MNALSSAFQANPADIKAFIEGLFCYADAETFISLRAFDQTERARPPILIEGVRIGEGTEQIVAKAARASLRAANSSRPGVFAPPVATFTNPRSAAESDIANGVAISVEIDEGDPVAARRRLEHILGPVTIAMHSGSEWLDPNTGEIHPKTHLHWRLSEPTRLPDEHAMLKRARWAAAVLVGADRTAAPPCHPLRWPGSWNLKSAPRIAKIYAGNAASEVHLDDVLEKLEEAVEAAGLKIDAQPHNAGADPQARIDRVRSALEHIPNTDVSWDQWNHLGMAAWRATGGSTDGMMAWADWSAKSGKHHEDECLARWQHYASSPPSKVGAGTIFYLAAQNGWSVSSKRDEIGMDDVPFAPVDGLSDEQPAAAKQMPKDPKPPRLLPIISFLEAEANLDAADFVEGVLIEGGLSVVYGQSNAGKTFWCTDIGFHVAAGLPWNGREVTQGVVLYLALEGSYGILNRIAAFKIEHGYEDFNIPFLVAPVGLDLLKPDGDVEAVIATAKAAEVRFESKVLLIVIDTVARATAGGNENSSEDMGAFIRNLDTIRQETEAHVMGIHHSGKDEARGARGWSGLRAAIDTEIEVKAEGDTKTAEIMKQRDMPKGDVFGFSLKTVVLGQNRRGKDVTSCVVESTDSQVAGATSDRRKSLKGHNKRALDVLIDLLASEGKPGHGAPPGVSSVPDKWWRERFYESSMAGAEQKTKEKAFRRAADFLVESRFVAMRVGRVWTVKKPTTQETNLETHSGDNGDNGDI